ncbi:Lrp/AsnC family transcriptional regulator [Peterkaempfera sp. SMS 1(5)a]|uniref:Lrp/AsnC family transcriptional regulator n=1 Tax=Peterkaempfera podocarpi TaxID=3232308 RepID=UPI00366CDD86
MKSDSRDEPSISPIDLGETDNALAHALHIDGRAPFAKIADILGVSDQTAARRYARLRRTGTLAVLGLTNALRSGENHWLLRVRAAPEAAVPLGEALARRDDTSWVSLVSGGTEVCCTVRERPGRQHEHLLLHQLPRTPQVTDVQAYAVLHVFFGNDQSPLTRSGPLTPEQVQTLEPEDAPDGSELGRPLDDDERRLLAVLARDGRAPLTELGQATGWSLSTVRRRLSHLRRTGVLYYDIDLAPRLLDRGMHAGLWLDIDPASLERAGTAMAQHPEVSFAAATTGSTNLYASLHCADAPSLYRYLTTRIATIPGMRSCATAPVHRTLKGAGPMAPRPRSHSHTERN